MLFLILFDEIYQNTPRNYSKKLRPGLYNIEIQGATGGNGCKSNINTDTHGGNGANIKAQVMIRGETEVKFKIGEKPETFCNKGVANSGGWPGGGLGGEDMQSGNDWAGGGGGYTEMTIDDYTIMLAGGGAGGCRPDSEGPNGFGGGLHTFGGYDKNNNPILIPETERTEDSRTGEQGTYAKYYWPGGGGGGGWRGGIGGYKYSPINDQHCVAFGGSSYINDTDNYWFLGTPVVLNGLKLLILDMDI